MAYGLMRVVIFIQRIKILKSLFCHLMQVVHLSILKGQKQLVVSLVICQGISVMHIPVRAVTAHALRPERAA